MTSNEDKAREITYVECSSCGWTHFAAKESDFKNPSDPKNKICFRCGHGNCGIVSEKNKNAPRGSTIQPWLVYKD